jgi:hypothetical protein
MRRFLTLLALILALGVASPTLPDAYAQSRNGDISGALDRLKNNPRYRGDIIGTQVRRTAQGSLLEVQVLRRDDSVVVVYIDPRTGGVVGDSDASGRGNTRGQGRGNR